MNLLPALAALAAALLVLFLVTRLAVALARVVIVLLWAAALGGSFLGTLLNPQITLAQGLLYGVVFGGMAALISLPLYPYAGVRFRKPDAAHPPPPAPYPDEAPPPPQTDGQAPSA